MNTLFFSLILIVISTLVVVSESFQWSRLESVSSSFRPPHREHAALEWTPAALYIFGGKASTGALSDTWYFSFYSNSWTALTSLLDKPSPRYGFLSGKIGNYWYITHGRSDEKGQVFSDTWAFHFDTNQWYQVNITGEDVPAGRYFASGGTNPSSSHNLLWMSMGVDKVGRKLSDTWILSINVSSPLEGVWKKVSDGVGLNQYSPSLPHARSEASGIPFNNGHFILNGGCASGGQVGGPCPLDDTWLFQSSDSSWSRLPSCTPPSRFSSFVPLSLQSSDIVLQYGGTQTGPKKTSQAISGTKLKSDELYFFNITSLQWTHVRVSGSGNGSSVPLLRSGAQLATGAAGVYMFGGKDESGNLLNDIWLLERTSSNLTPLPCSVKWFTFLHLHGIIMYIAWGLLLPLGALVGRHYKWTVRPIWFAIHLICQIIGAILTFVGFIIVLAVSSEPSFPHGVIGIILVLTITQQFLSGIIRPWSIKKHKKRFENKDSYKYKWKKCWKVYHQASGHIAIALGFVQVTLGTLLINGPAAVWIIWCILLSLWLIVFVGHEIFHCFYNKLGIKN